MRRGRVSLEVRLFPVRDRVFRQAVEERLRGLGSDEADQVGTRLADLRERYPNLRIVTANPLALAHATDGIVYVYRDGSAVPAEPAERS
jgi:hypothetical protein